MFCLPEWRFLLISHFGQTFTEHPLKFPCNLWNKQSLYFLFPFQDRSSQHQWRQLCVPFSRRGELLGQAGPSHLSPAALHDCPRLVGRGRGAGLEEAVTKTSHGGLWKSRETSETQPRADVHWRLRRDDSYYSQAERRHVAARPAV